MKNILKNIVNWVIINIGKIHWKYKNGLDSSELNIIRNMLKKDYYIILTHRKNHLSTFFVGLSNWLLVRKWGYWAHALMNLEDEVKSNDDFRLIEAIGTGVKYSSFEQVFDVHGVVLLKPRSMPIEYWTAVMDKAITEIGKPYDSLFDLRNDNSLSCVELVRIALKAEADYEVNFSHFESMIQKNKNLTPEMFYSCDDFEIVYELRHL